jgi:hypothetical protein
MRLYRGEVVSAALMMIAGPVRAAECDSEQEALRRMNVITALSLDIEWLEPKKRIRISKVIGKAASRILAIRAADSNYMDECRVVEDAQHEISRMMCGRVENGACRD